MRRVRGGYGLGGLLVVLLVAVAVLPWIRRTFARSFPEGFQSPFFQACDSNVKCAEGEFCAQNVCRKVTAPATNDPVGGSS